MPGHTKPRDPSWKLLRAKGHHRHRDKRERQGRKAKHQKDLRRLKDGQ